VRQLHSTLYSLCTVTVNYPIVCRG